MCVPVTLNAVPTPPGWVKTAIDERRAVAPVDRPREVAERGHGVGVGEGGDRGGRTPCPRSRWATAGRVARQRRVAHRRRAGDRGRLRGRPCVSMTVTVKGTPADSSGGDPVTGVVDVVDLARW